MTPLSLIEELPRCDLHLSHSSLPKLLRDVLGPAFKLNMIYQGQMMYEMNYQEQNAPQTEAMVGR